MTVSAEFRGTECYVAWGAKLKGRLFFLGSSLKNPPRVPEGADGRPRIRAGAIASSDRAAAHTSVALPDNLPCAHDA